GDAGAEEEEMGGAHVGKSTRSLERAFPAKSPQRAATPAVAGVVRARGDPFVGRRRGSWRRGRRSSSGCIRRMSSAGLERQACHHGRAATETRLDAQVAVQERSAFLHSDNAEFFGGGKRWIKTDTIVFDDCQSFVVASLQG